MATSINCLSIRAGNEHSYPTIIDPKLDAMAYDHDGKGLHVARTRDHAMDERKSVENQLDGLDSKIISSIEHSPPIRQHYCC